MCKVIEDLCRKEREEGREEGRKEGIEMGQIKAMIESVKGIIDTLHLDPDEAVTALKIPEQYRETVCKAIDEAL